MQLVYARFKKLDPSARVPEYQHTDDAAMDVFTCKDEVVPPHKITLIKVGFAMEFLDNCFCAHLVGRSGLTLKGFIVHHGLIDPNYRGEIGVICQNITDEPMTFPKGSRIAQLFATYTFDIRFHELLSLTDTDRGAAGYGSSGV